jgi:hypothetical protein
MKKLLAFLVLAAAAVAVYLFLLRSPGKRACLRVADLCGLEPMGAETQRCLKMLDSLKTSNAAAVADFATCTGEAKSCPGALGCASGAALHIGTGLVQDLFTGFSKTAGCERR